MSEAVLCDLCSRPLTRDELEDRRAQPGDAVSSSASSIDPPACRDCLEGDPPGGR